MHFLPSLLFDGILFSVVFVYFGNNLDWAYENILGIQSTALSLSLLGIVQLSIYTYLTYKESIEAKKVLRDFQGVRKWLKYLLGVWILLICFFLIAVPISLVFIENVDENSALLYKPLGIIIGGGIYLLGYLYIARYAKVVDNYIERISNFTFSAADLAKWKGNILHALEKEKLFRDAGITVGQLAKHLGLPINSLSHIINESFDTNFSDLINHHRILAFKELVLQPDSKKYSILGMGQEVGFSSKASFYRAFKKETGLTPSDYIKSQG
ncbi:MAG: helix-turn-helix domain-containing protein [Bacteroidota bacterium]